MNHILPRPLRRRWNQLWALDHFLGRGRVDRWMPQRRAATQAAMAEALEAHPRRSWGRVDEVEHIEAADFHRDYVQGDRPLIIRGAARHWAAAQQWDFDFFIEHYGEEPIDVIRAGIGDSVEDRAGPRRALGEILREAHDGEGEYPRFAPLLHRHPELVEHLDVDWLERYRGPSARGTVYQIFLGGPGSTTAMHNAIGSNHFIQLEGRKRWHIVSPAWTPALDVELDRAPYFFSLADVRNPDPERFPHLDRVEVLVADLEAGDVLYNPPFFWHQVENLTPSIGVGMRTYDGPAMMRASAMMTLLTLCATNPSLPTTLRLNGDFSAMFTGRWRQLSWLPRRTGVSWRW